MSTFATKERIGVRLGQVHARTVSNGALQKFQYLQFQVFLEHFLFLLEYRI